MADKIIKAETNAVAPSAVKSDAVAVPAVKTVETPAAAVSAPAPVVKVDAPKADVAKLAMPAAATPAAKPAEPAKPVVAEAAPIVAKPVKVPVGAKTETVVKTQTKAIKTPQKTKTVTKPAVAAAPATPTIQKEESIMESTIKTATDKAQTMFVDMNDRAKAAMEKTQGLFTDMNEFNKGNVEALVESSKIAAKGIESMGQDAAEYTRKSFEGMTAVIKSLGTIKSPTEFMKLHSDYVRTSFDSLVAESSKNTEAMLKLAGEIAQPISNRVAVAAEKMKISA